MRLMYCTIEASISSPPMRIERLVTMPPSEITAISVVPPPISTTMLPVASSTGSPAPIAAAMGSSIRYASRAPACCAASMTARFSTSVTPDGTPTTTRGRTNDFERIALRMKYLSIACVTSKSAITPSFIGRIATILPGVRPIICLASSPTASTSPESFLIATTEGSRRTIPRPFTCTSVFAVPRSIPISCPPKRPNIVNGVSFQQMC